MDTKTRKLTMRDTPVTYSAAEAAALRKAFAQGDQSMTCPQCGGRLVIDPPFECQGRMVSELYCDDCQRCVIVRMAK